MLSKLKQSSLGIEKSHAFMYNWKSKLNWKIGIDRGDSKMIFSVISILVSICFCIVVMKGSQIEPANKTKKIASVIYNVLLISPIIATITFLILFSTVLKGRLIERSSHALIVFVLWVYGTAFYINILKFFKNKILLFTCLSRNDYFYCICNYPYAA